MNVKLLENLPVVHRSLRGMRLFMGLRFLSLFRGSLLDRDFTNKVLAAAFLDYL